MSESKFITRLKISSIVDNKDGTSTLNFDLDADFIEWFKKDQGLKRFSHKRFQKVMSEAIKNAAIKDKSSLNGFVGTITSDKKS